jgi:hypothetical protein
MKIKLYESNKKSNNIKINHIYCIVTFITNGFRRNEKENRYFR